MNDFINGLIERHLNLRENVRPRIPGVYESGRLFSIKRGNHQNDLSYIQLDNKQENSNLESRFIKLSKDRDTNSIVLKDFSKLNHTNTTDPIALEKVEDVYKNQTDDGIRKTKEVNDASLKHKIISEHPTFAHTLSNKKLPSYTFQPEKANDDSASFKDSTTGMFAESLAQTTNKLKLTLTGSSDNKRNISGQFRSPSLSVNRNSDLVNAGQNKTSLQITPPTIKVNIGRIEIKAIKETEAIKPVKRNLLKPRLSLDNYIRKRDESKR